MITDPSQRILQNKNKLNVSSITSANLALLSSTEDRFERLKVVATSIVRTTQPYTSSQEMKTNPKQAANGRSRPANGRRAPLARGGGPTNSVKNRIGKPVAKPTGDLRQMLAKKVTKSSPNKPAEKPISNVKSRLGLQSLTAKLEAKQAAKAQLQAIRDKNVSVLSE